MKLVAGEVDVVKDDIRKVVCLIDSFSNMMKLSFYKKDNLVFKSVNITGLDVDIMKKA